MDPKGAICFLINTDTELYREAIGPLGSCMDPKGAICFLINTDTELYREAIGPLGSNGTLQSKKEDKNK